MTEMTYEKVKDYYLPIFRAEEKLSLGKYAILRLSHLKKNRPVLYQAMKADGTLLTHLHETDMTAKKATESMTTLLAKTYDLTEELKAKDPMMWAKKMKELHLTAEETVLKEMIYI
ncbi:MAG: TnpV protein [Eubacteriaceae bacterium]|nr:TnpV protein [Eubacteriaceae bacterium]